MELVEKGVNRQSTSLLGVVMGMGGGEKGQGWVMLMWREEAAREAQRNVVVVLLLLGGKGRVASDVVGDWADKGLEGTGEGIYVRPGVIVNGLNHVAIRAVMDQSR